MNSPTYDPHGFEDALDLESVNYEDDEGDCEDCRAERKLRFTHCPECAMYLSEREALPVGARWRVLVDPVPDALSAPGISPRDVWGSAR